MVSSGHHIHCSYRGGKQAESGLCSDTLDGKGDARPIHPDCRVEWFRIVPEEVSRGPARRNASGRGERLAESYRASQGARLNSMTRSCRAGGMLAVSCGLLAAQGGRLGAMHAPVGQSEQLSPEARQGAALRTATLEIQVVLDSGESLSIAPLVMESSVDQDVCRIASVFRNGRIRLGVPIDPEDSRMPGRDPRPVSCFLPKVMLAGYRSFSGTVRDGMVITLHRLSEQEGSTVSITTLRAPDNARKAYERGEAAMIKRNWGEAQKRFEQATAIYPVYAMAWSECGVALEQQGLFEGARRAFRESVSADPKYIKPIVQFAGLEGRQQHWQEEMELSKRALVLHAVEFPEAYFYYAEAAYHLGRLQDAETSVREALQLDQYREFPKTHFLLGLVLAEKGESSAAVEELTKYLKLAPRASDAKKAKEKIAQLTFTGAN
jgi:tetratricopeptide (TPR) repeat protein